MKKTILLPSLLFSVFTLAQTPNYIPTSGLVAWWEFKGNANDTSGNNNNLTVNGATLTADRNGNANAAYSFNGTSNYLTKSSLSYNFSQSGSYSISMWIKKTDNTSGIAMMSGSSTNNNFIWLLQYDTTKAIYGTNKQGQAWTWLNGPVYSTGWEHYVVVYNNQSMQLYKNGISVGTTSNTYTGTLSAALPLFIGKGISSSGYINGSIDDVGIWSRVLTPAEITQLYTGTLSTNEVQTVTTGNIAPNPASDFIKINLPLKSTKTYKITDMNGRMVLQGNISDEKTITISSLLKGEYLIEIEGVKKLKFIKK
ncbi:LamG-like jellyroll fold domain-containing protein [Chryseobacterium sp. T20]|uniref:LamG-like jellyroll fold domain-containing protein n=1 Tax=Chryseobacterium sp. T20 TaxID=3395375 RepID=UPI0039BD7109